MNHTNERMRRPIVWISILGALVIVAAAIVTVTSTSDEPGSDSDTANPESAAVDYDQALAGAPAPLAKLYAQGDALIPGGADAYEAELAKLRGHPVVVNKWASWCGPCRYEFPFFQSQAAQQGKRIAFLGVDTEDSEDAARTFLDELPLPYPSVSDPDKEVDKIIDGFYNPSTAFYSPAGELLHTKLGGYASESELEADIKRYLG